MEKFEIYNKFIFKKRKSIINKKGLNLLPALNLFLMIEKNKQLNKVSNFSHQINQ